jgi:D-alanyl-D-alanine carboxypeptidase/D-alanyl-D-alanine-endopeptidase (penicillin-binding protein 4)
MRLSVPFSPALLPLLLATGLLGCLSPAFADEESKLNRGFEGCYATRGAGDGSSQIVAAELEDSLFVPASVQKLFTAIVALHHLGPDYRVETPLRAFGTLSSGSLRGDLVVEASGDPTWNRDFYQKDPRAPLRQIAHSLRAAGVLVVEGDLVIDVGAFPGWDYPPSRPIAEMAFGYSSPVSALAIDQNTTRWWIGPGTKLGERARIRGIDPRLEVTNSSTTVGPERDGRGSLEILPIWDSSRLIVRGEFPISEREFQLDVSVPHPDEWAGSELLRILREEGVAVRGKLRLTSGLAELSSARPIATFRSLPLRELLEPILTDSDNWYAEMLLRLVAREVTGQGRLDAGIDVLDAFMTDVVGADLGSFAFEDGSGLSVENLVTPRATVQLLEFAWRQEWRDVLLDSLATPQRGTLEHWPKVLPIRVMAKTGTLKYATSLAGYVDPQTALPGASAPLTFACFLNHRQGLRQVQRGEIARRLRDWSQ